jgi:hypothetical protein
MSLNDKTESDNGGKPPVRIVEFNRVCSMVGSDVGKYSLMSEGVPEGRCVGESERGVGVSVAIDGDSDGARVRVGVPVGDREGDIEGVWI